jgi:hypothetical protein
MKGFNRRDFLHALGLSGGLLASGNLVTASRASSRPAKPILGSWFEFQHHNIKEGIPWNPACAAFTCGQWDAKVKEVADLGMEYLVLLCTALHFKAFYRTQIPPPVRPLLPVLRNPPGSILTTQTGSGKTIPPC